MSASRPSYVIANLVGVGERMSLANLPASSPAHLLTLFATAGCVWLLEVRPAAEPSRVQKDP